VTLSLAICEASLRVAYRLSLPGEQAEDLARRRAGVRKKTEFQTRPEMALEQIAQAPESGLPCGAVVAGAGCGPETRFRERPAGMGLEYGVCAGRRERLAAGRCRICRPLLLAGLQPAAVAVHLQDPGVARQPVWKSARQPLAA